MERLRVRWCPHTPHLVICLCFFITTYQGRVGKTSLGLQLDTRLDREKKGKEEGEGRTQERTEKREKKNKKRRNRRLNGERLTRRRLNRKVKKNESADTSRTTTTTIEHSLSLHFPPPPVTRHIPTLLPTKIQKSRAQPIPAKDEEESSPSKPSHTRTLTPQTLPAARLDGDAKT